MNTFIYALKEPDTGEIRYIGKSDSPKERLFVHLADKARNHRTNWIKSLCGKPILEILDEVPVEHWQQWEVAYIEFFREQGCNLVNGTLGGEGGPRLTGKRKLSQGHKNKISKALEGHFGFWTGKKLPVETKEKMSSVKKGKKSTLETRQRMSEASFLREEKKRQEKSLAEMWR